MAAHRSRKFNQLSRPQVFRTEHRLALASLFRCHRLLSGLSEDNVVHNLDLPDSNTLLAYEAGTLPIPMDDVFALTNFLNVPPEDVITLMWDLYAQGSSQSL